MTKSNQRFASLFKKYRLRSEIETLAEFGDLLAQEGIVYENSLFTRWQKGERVPSDRKVMISILKVFVKRGGIHSRHELNQLFESSGLGYLTDYEINNFPFIPDSTPFLVPRKLDHFIERKDISQLVRNRLLDNTVTLLYGQPGIGKTSIAINAAHNLKSIFLDGILWYQLNTSNPMDILLSIAQVFGKDISNISDISIRSSIVRSITSEKNLLFIFDNAEDDNSLEYLLPVGNKCATLITSINPFITSNYIECKIQVRPFDLEDTIALFRMINGDNYVTINHDGIKQLFHEVNGHPLALKVIAKQIFYSNKSIHTYLTSLRKDITDLKTFVYQNKTLDIVLAAIFNKLNPLEKQFIVSIAIFHGKDYSVNAVSFINDTPYEKTLEILEKLENYSLINHYEKNTFRVHPLIRLFFTKKLDSKLYEKAAYFYLKQLKKNITKQNYYIFISNEFENIKYIFEFCLKHNKWKLVFPLWEYLSDYLWHSRHWVELELYVKKIFKSLTLHKNYKFTISSLLKLSNLYYWERDINLAEKYIQESCKLAKISNDKESLYRSQQLLGRIYIGRKNLKKAKKLINNSLNYFKKTSINIEDIAQCYKYLGEIELRRGHHNNSFNLFKLANTAYGKCNIKASRLVNQAICTIYMGEIYLLKDDVHGAEKLFKQGLNLCRKSNERWGVQTFGYLGLGLIYEQTKKDKGINICITQVKKGIDLVGFREYLINQNSFYFALKNNIEKSLLFKPLFIS